jgi:hypothetical protein
LFKGLDSQELGVLESILQQTAQDQPRTQHLRTDLPGNPIQPPPAEMQAGLDCPPPSSGESLTSQNVIAQTTPLP